MRDPSVWSYQTPVPFDILVASGSPEVFSYSDAQANQAVIDFVCVWTDRYTVNDYLLGTGVYGQSPVRHPSRLDLFAKRTVLTGIGPRGFDGEQAQYRYAKLNVTFLQNPQGQIGNPNTTGVISVESENTSEYMTVPGREVTWVDDGLPLPDPASIYIPQRTHKITVHQWFSPPFSAMDSAQGKINSLAVSWVGRSIGAECLLFEGYQESYDIYVQGIASFKVGMTFKERPRSWNKLPKPNLVFEKTDPLLFGSPVSFAGIFP